MAMSLVRKPEIRSTPPTISGTAVKDAVGPGKGMPIREPAAALIRVHEFRNALPEGDADRHEPNESQPDVLRVERSFHNQITSIVASVVSLRYIRHLLDCGGALARTRI
jgi:hypothetical protein